jgi:cytochrome c
MKKHLFAGLTLALAGLSIGGAAQANADLAKSKNCMACHALDKKVVGPAFKDVAARYKGGKDGQARLAASIAKGSTGAWGPIPMPANAVSEAEAQTLAKWVLTQK